MDDLLSNEEIATGLNFESSAPNKSSAAELKLDDKA